MLAAKRTTDGSEGTGTIELTYQTTKERKEIITISGCFVENDQNLQRFISNNISSSADFAQFDKNKYSFYFVYALESDYRELNPVTTTVTYYRYSETKIEKKCEIENPQIIKVDNHSFLLCNSKEINDSKFLEKHSKRIMTGLSLDARKNVYGLSQDQQSKTKIKFIPFKMKHCGAINIYSCIDERCYEKLEDAGPILLPYGKENVVAGGYRKTDNGRISISIFGKNQDEKSKDFSDGSGKGGVREEKGNDIEESKIGEAASLHPEKHSEETGNTQGVAQQATNTEVSYPAQGVAQQAGEVNYPGDKPAVNVTYNVTNTQVAGYKTEVVNIESTSDQQEDKDVCTRVQEYTKKLKSHGAE